MDDRMTTDPVGPVPGEHVDEGMRARMLSLVDQIVTTSRTSAWLWAGTGLIGSFTLGMAIHGGRTLLAVISLAGIGFAIWNVRTSLDASRKAATWRDQWTLS